MLRRLLATAVIAASPALAFAGGASAASWRPPVRLTGSDPVVAPDLATAGAGSAVAVWDREVGSACANQPANPACVHVVEARSRRAATACWDPPIEIARPGVGSAPQVAVDPQGDALVLWSHDIGVDRVLQTSLRRGATGKWEEPVDLSEPSPSIGAHAVALDPRGNAFAVWVDASGVNAAVRPWSSGVWSAPAHLSRPGGAAPADPKLVVDDGDAIVVWSAGGVVQKSEYLGGAEWSSAVDIGVGASPVAARSPVRSLILWTDRDTVFAANLQYGRTTPFAFAVGTEPSVAFDDDDDGVAAWSRAGTIEASYHEPYAPDWSFRETLGQGSEPQVVLTAGGNAVAAWLDGGVYAALRPAGSEKWTPALAISADGASDLRLRSAGAGAEILWSRAGQVETAQLDASGPLVGKLEGPSEGLVGDELGFAVEAAPWASPLAGDPTWTFGDGASATGSFVEHAYAAVGTYQISVTQADVAGGTTTATRTVTIRATAPVVLSRPTVRGRARVGATLTCTRGRWEGTPPIRFAYAWLRGARPIPSARGRRYRIRPQDRGRALACRVTASNGAGSSTSRSRAVRVAGRM